MTAGQESPPDVQRLQSHDTPPQAEQRTYMHSPPAHCVYGLSLAHCRLPYMGLHLYRVRLISSSFMIPAWSCETAVTFRIFCWSIANLTLIRAWPFGFGGMPVR